MNLQWLAENALTILSSSTLFGAVGWFFGGKQQKEKDLKKQDVEIDSAEVDYAEKVRQLYDKLEEKWIKEREEFIIERVEYKETFKTLSNRIDILQEQFNSLNLAYVKEVEKSQYWMQKYDELDKKYNELINANKELINTNIHLEKLVEDLKLAHDQLKKEFDKHKRLRNENK